MKAITISGYGAAEDVLRLADVPVPAVGPDDVLVRVRAASLNPQDWHIMTGIPMLMRPAAVGLRGPKVTGIGSDFAGEVAAVGDGVTGILPGDRVFGMVGQVPGASVPDLGSVADFVRAPADRVHAIPDGMDDDEAAALPLVAATAVEALVNVARVRPGHRVLVHGASGGVGTAAVQVAVALGAEVTGVCSTPNVDLVASLGAVDVVDHRHHDVTTGPERFDVVLDNAGSHGVHAMRRILADDGIYMASFGRKERRVTGPFGHMVRMAALGPFVSQRLVGLRIADAAAALATAVDMVRAGALRGVVGRTHAMPDTVAAMAHVASGHNRGKVVITV